MDRIDIIESLQVVWNIKTISLSNSVDNVIRITLQDYIDIIKKWNEKNLNINPLEYFQWTNWILIKKESNSEYINDVRIWIYNYLESVLWEINLKSLFLILNSATSLAGFKEYISHITDLTIIENIHVLSIIELELIWKRNLSNILINVIIDKNNILELENIKSNKLDIYKVLWIFLYSIGDHIKSFELLKELQWTDELNKDKDLLAEYIMLNKILNDDKWVKDLLVHYYNILDTVYNSDDYDSLEFSEELAFLFENYLDYYLKEWNELEKLRDASLFSISLWNDNANFHLVYSYIKMGDFNQASSVYNAWKWNNQEEKIILSTENLIELEKFYIDWYENWIMWSINLLVTFYREQFELNWYNDEFFNNLVLYTSECNYNFSDKDNIFFEIFTEEFEKMDNNEKILELIERLFIKYSSSSFSLYLDKILLVISKYLHLKYNDNLNILKIITIWFEHLAIIEELNSIDSWNTELYNKKLIEKVNLLWDLEYLEVRFNELLYKFCVFNLSNIDNYSKDLNIPIYLASIFEYYGMFEDMNKALEYDEFFKEKKLINKSN